MVLPDLILNQPMSPTFPMCAEQFVSLLNLSAQLHPTLREVCFIQELWELVGRGGVPAVTIFYCSAVSPLGSAPTRTLPVQSHYQWTTVFSSLLKVHGLYDIFTRGVLQYHPKEEVCEIVEWCMQSDLAFIFSL